MEIHGLVQNGVIILIDGPSLPEGTLVSVSPAARNPSVPQPPATEIVREPGKLPYVHGGIPGTWELTNERIAEIFEEEDIEMMKGKWNVPS